MSTLDSSDAALQDVRPRFREDALWLPLRGGVVFRTHALSFRLVGPPLREVMETLVPLADGSRTVSEILAAFPEVRRATLLALMRVLLQRGVLLDHAPGGIADARVRAAFDEQIRFVRHFTDSDEAFLRFRDAPLLLAGDGDAFVACAASLLRFGLHRLTLCPLDAVTPLDAVFEAAAHVRALDVDTDVTVLERTGDRLPAVDPYAMVAYCSSEVRVPELVWFNRDCSRARRSLLVGVALGSQTLLGPVIDGVASGCWICGFVRLAPDLLRPASLPDFMRPTLSADDAAEAAAEIAHARGRDDGSHELHRLLGNEMAFELLKYLAGGLRPQTVDHVIVSTAEAPDSFSARCVPHPLCGCMRFCTEVFESQTS